MSERKYSGFEVGDVVETQELVDEKYNALHGSILETVNSSGRHPVRLNTAGGGTADMCFKEKNLVLVKCGSTQGGKELAQPFYDENVAPEYRDSLIFQDQYYWKDFVDCLYNGNDVEVPIQFEGHPFTSLEFRPVHCGAMTAALPWTVAILR
eukprot:2063873-Rhodomonas_salina.1